MIPLLSYRLRVLSRTAAAAGGGYALMATSSYVLARGLSATGMPPTEAVMGATIIGFVVFCVAALWCFGTRSAWRAWAGTILPALALALLALGMAPGTQP